MTDDLPIYDDDDNLIVILPGGPSEPPLTGCAGWAQLIAMILVVIFFLWLWWL